MYKYANDMLPPVMNELFIVNSTIHDHNTRQRNFIHTNRGHTDISYRSFNNVGPRVWNVLRNKINVNVPISQFKQKNHEISTRSLTCYRVPKVVLISNTVSFDYTLNAYILPYLYESTIQICTVIHNSYILICIA